MNTFTKCPGNRVRYSDDNPYAEALFRTMKYRPGSPTGPFTSLAEARGWVAGFVAWYASRDVAIVAHRREVYARAARKRPERWSQQPRQWERPEVARLTPLREDSAA